MEIYPRDYETTSLLHEDREGYEEIITITPFQDFKIKLKKYYLFPLILFIPLLLWLSLAQSGNELNNYDDSLPILTSSNALSSLKIPSSDWSNHSTGVTYFTLEITKSTLAPDSVPNEVFLVNGLYPGPLIRIPPNNILVLTVRNYLNVPITIHLHGIHQRGSYLSDGVPFVTQDPILPGQNFTQIVNVWPQSGTFFYHAHTGLDIVWISGPLVIEDEFEGYSKFPPDYQYDEDRLFLINGLYHESLDSVVDKILGPVHDYPRLASVLINGKSSNKFKPGPNGTFSSTRLGIKGHLDVTKVEAKKRYRFRFINSASDGMFSCSIGSHKFKIIEMDGVYSTPVETDSLVLSPGQRYSIIVEMDQEEDNYLITCAHMELNGPFALSVLSYSNAPPSPHYIPPPASLVNDSATIPLSWVLSQLGPNYALNQTDVYKVPTKVDKEWVLNAEEVVIGTQHFYTINGHFFKEPNVSYHTQVGNGVNITDEPQVFEFRKGDVVQFIFQNQRTDTVCFAHPWHIHGHSFYVVGYGPNKYDPIRDKELIESNVRNGIPMQFRDSVTVNGEQTEGSFTNGEFCGWTAVRFIANNPGVWLAHCHVTPHMMMGKRFVMWEHDNTDPYLSFIHSTDFTKLPSFSN